MTATTGRDPFTGTAKLAEIRARIDHPIVDVDAHQLEVVPVLLEFLRDEGGPALPERWIEYMGWARRTFRMTPEERLRTRTGMPVWWPVPTEITLDRATTQLPSLLYQRLDEIGLDFSIVYPGMGLLILTLPGMADEDLRRGSARAFNAYYAEMFRGFEDRMVPAAVIPMHTPEEAIEELEHAVGTLGHKVVVMAGDVLRPNPAFAAEHPALADQVLYQDCFGIDSPYDYDPVWEACRRLRVAPTFHSGPIGWGCRASVSRHQYNQLGGFAEGGEALAKSLFFGGVTYRFPDLRFGFLEGGVAWGQSLYCRMLEHWGKRNAEAILRLDPSRLDGARFGELIDRYGHPRVQAHRDRLVADSLWADHPEELDDWRSCGITRPEDVRDRFVPPFFFGCEGDDVLNANAFDERTNPFGARLGAMFGSDIGHFDVEDMREIVEEVYELVEDGLFTERDFRDFMCHNPIRLHGGMNADFFDGTPIEAEAKKVLSGG
jgi:predicted TIM-barrel fold metal-dependent hydrolase